MSTGGLLQALLHAHTRLPLRPLPGESLDHRRVCGGGRDAVDAEAAGIFQGSAPDETDEGVLAGGIGAKLRHSGEPWGGGREGGRRDCRT
jgi:hypothetical protein